MRTGALPVAARDRLAGFVAVLPSRFEAVLKSAVDVQARAFGLPPQQPRLRREGPYGGPSRERVFVEVLATDGGFATLDVAAAARRLATSPEGPSEQPESLDVWIAGIGQPGIEAAVEELCAAFAEQFGVSLGEFSYTADRFDQLKGDGIDAAVAATPEELASARLLCDPSARAMATAIASSGGLLAGDAAQQLGSAEASGAQAVTQSLIAAGLIESEIVVICRRTSRQVARVPGPETLEEMRRVGVRCACGADISQERAEASLTITSPGRLLLQGSRWLAVIVMDELRALGIPPESILLEHGAGGEQTNCFVDISGELVLIDLADREFSLGNAYAFGAKIGTHQPAHSVIVTSAYAGDDAKEHFQRAEVSAAEDEFWHGRRGAPNQVTFIEGVERLRSGLQTLVSDIYARDAERILAELLPSANVDAGKVVAAIAGRPASASRPTEDVRPPEPSPRSLRIRSTAPSAPETLQWET